MHPSAPDSRPSFRLIEHDSSLTICSASQTPSRVLIPQTANRRGIIKSICATRYITEEGKAAGNNLQCQSIRREASRASRDANARKPRNRTLFAHRVLKCPNLPMNAVHAVKIDPCTVYGACRLLCVVYRIESTRCDFSTLGTRVMRLQQQCVPYSSGRISVYRRLGVFSGVTGTQANI